MSIATLLVLFLACGAAPEEAVEVRGPEPVATEPADDVASKERGKTVKNIDCNTTGYTLGGKVGDKMRVKCPSSCSSGSVWGDGRYTPDSSVCRAGVHAGAIPASGGTFLVQFKEKFGPFEGAERNGVASSAWSTPYEPSLVMKGRKKK